MPFESRSLPLSGGFPGKTNSHLEKTHFFVPGSGYFRPGFLGNKHKRSKIVEINKKKKKWIENKRKG